MAVVYDTILSRIASGKKMLVRLIDPEKFEPSTLCDGFSLFFVGGSTASGSEAVVRAIHQQTTTPAVLFPGNIRQFTPEADALLLLTLMNSRDPKFLIEPHLQAASAIAASGIESIPMGYILLDGGRQSAVERVTGCKALLQSDTDAVVSTAIAAELLGKKLVYLEAGSGAKSPVTSSAIRAV
ncbi:MAG: geranylgeranylglyceryl/heptaprenylglyceryl phosphate synthase, partial [Paludibacteraceae bacterium]|nr:geranylgeranylglyceryl/heptaprenylglyceryl phosphate synthase [Paludibacteraceae bacterium]